MASDVSDIPSDRALVPNLVDRAFMSKYAASGATNHDQAFDSVSNSDPLVWGVRVDDHTQTADPVKVGSLTFHSNAYMCQVRHYLERINREGVARVKMFFIVTIAYLLFWGPLFLVCRLLIPPINLSSQNITNISVTTNCQI